MLILLGLRHGSQYLEVIRLAVVHVHLVPALLLLLILVVVLLELRRRPSCELRF